MTFTVPSLRILPSYMNVPQAVVIPFSRTFERLKVFEPTSPRSLARWRVVPLVMVVTTMFVGHFGWRMADRKLAIPDSATASTANWRTRYRGASIPFPAVDPDQALPG